MRNKYCAVVLQRLTNIVSYNRLLCAALLPQNKDGGGEIKLLRSEKERKKGKSKQERMSSPLFKLK